MWNALGLRSALALVVIGALLISEAILSHVFAIAWSGTYGWQRVLAIVLGAGAIVAGAIRLWQVWSGWPSQQAVSGFRRRWTPFLVAAAVHRPESLRSDVPDRGAR
jgi:hypothetical protein